MRRLVFALIAAGCLLLGVSAPAGAVTISASSSNWSGYATGGAGVRYRRVSGAWTVSPVSCTGTATSASTWVGLGGLVGNSEGLEQAGTDADCSRSGRATYSAWYELLPDAAHDLAITVRPGDKISTSVEVSGRDVTLRLRDKTRGTSVVKRTTAAVVDLSSADWVVEAPENCIRLLATTTCVPSKLSDFGTTRFAHARTTTTDGRTGTINDPAWAAAVLTLDPAAGADGPGGDALFPTGRGLAVPSALNAAGDSFAVSYVTSPAAAS